MTRSAKEVVTELFERLARGDESAIDELVAEDLVNHTSAPPGRLGIKIASGAAKALFGSSAQEETLHLFGEGDLVVQHHTLSGVHEASPIPWMHGIEPTGLRVTWTLIHIWRVCDGLVVEHWACRDDLGLLRQLGAWQPHVWTATKSD